MTEPTRLNRRTVLRATGATLAVSLAGCAGDNGGEEFDFVDAEPDYDGWFDDVANYEGTVDATDRDEVTIEVGAGDGLQYAPPAVQITPGTRVVWEWTGEGGDHNVAAEDGRFESETRGDAGFEFEHTFDEGGTLLYVCTPHEAVGMKGAVVVE